MQSGGTEVSQIASTDRKPGTVIHLYNLSSEKTETAQSLRLPGLPVYPASALALCSVRGLPSKEENVVEWVRMSAI